MWPQVPRLICLAKNHVSLEVFSITLVLATETWHIMAPFDHLQLKHADIFSSPTESANRAAILELFDPHPFSPFLSLSLVSPCSKDTSRHVA